jgi:acyl dehydratase
MQVERGAIRRYAEAIDDSNPIYWDVDYAKTTRYGELICPPGFFGWPIKAEAIPICREVVEITNKIPELTGLPTLLDASIEHEFVRPIRAGDTLTVIPRIVNIEPREAKGKKRVFFTYEISFINQNGSLVAHSSILHIFL